MKKSQLAVITLALLLAGCGGSGVSSASSVTPTSSAPASVAESTVSSTAEASSEPVASEAESSQGQNEDGTTTYTFEAEYCDGIEDMSGPAFSGTYTGLDMIQNDTKNKDYKASNGYYVTGLCVKGQTLTFKVTSDTAVSDAKFDWRISSEAYDLTLTTDNYSIYVNGKAIDYKDIEVSDVPNYQQGFKEFEDYTLTKRLSLVEGDNYFIFYTNNSKALGGTFTATAPLFDCFKVTTTAVLTWDPCTDNLAGRV